MGKRPHLFKGNVSPTFCPTTLQNFNWKAFLAAFCNVSLPIEMLASCGKCLRGTASFTPCLLLFLLWKTDYNCNLIRQRLLELKRSFVLKGTTVLLTV